MMHLIGMWFGDVPPLTQRIKFKFDEHVNVFVGPNASGKSTVLMALARYFEVLDGESEAKRPSDDFYIDEMTELDFDDIVDEEDPEHNIIAGSWDWFGNRQVGNPAVVHLNSVRNGLPGISVPHTDGERYQTVLEILSGPFSGSQTLKALDALARDAQKNQPDLVSLMKRLGIRRAIEVAVECSKKICQEVINDTTTRHYRTASDAGEYHDDPAGDLEQPLVLRSAAISTSDVRNFNNYPVRERPARDLDSGPIYIGHLSSGTEGTLLWVQWLALKMLHHYGFADEWEKQPAILLIDEIENHLHPTWQRRVIPALLEHFPGLQIFATTHSPFVVAGLEKGQVHMLKRDANGVVTASTNEHDIIGWTTDEILRTFMGVDEPTDQLTIDRRERLLELRRKDSLTDEEAAEMEELRRQVNEDFLSSSTPLAAQRERYGDIMLEFLRSRQSELSQDGS